MNLNTKQLRDALARLRDARIVRCQGIEEKKRARARVGETVSAEEARQQREEAQAARRNSLWFIDLETVVKMLNYRIISMFRLASDTRAMEADIKYGACVRASGPHRTDDAPRVSQSARTRSPECVPRKSSRSLSGTSGRPSRPIGWLAATSA